MIRCLKTIRPGLPRAPFALCVALVITKGEDYTCKEQEPHPKGRLKNPNDTTVSPIGAALSGYALLSDDTDNTQHYAGRNWHWQKNA